MRRHLCMASNVMPQFTRGTALTSLLTPRGKSQHSLRTAEKKPLNDSPLPCLVV